LRKSQHRKPSRAGEPFILWLKLGGIRASMLVIGEKASPAAWPNFSVLSPQQSPSPHQAEPGLGTGLSTEGVLWFFIVPASSFFWGVRYRRCAPSQGRLRQWPFLIGCLALTLWGVLLGLILGLAWRKRGGS